MRTRVIYLLPFISAFLWGYGFIPTVWALESMDPWWLMTYRFGLCTVAYLLIAVATKHWPTREAWKWGTALGVLLAGTLGFQTKGLVTTDVTNSGFLTVLYVVFTPILGSLFFKIKTWRTDWVIAAIALYGAYLLSGANLSTIKTGDLWTIAAAAVAAVHLLLVAKSPKNLNANHLNAVQIFVATIVCVGISTMAGEAQPIIIPTKAFLSLLSLSLVVAMIGFGLQFIAQRHIPPGPVAIIFLLESPIASIFAIILLADRLTPIQASGAAVIFLSSLIATYIHNRRTIKLDTQPTAG